MGERVKVQAGGGMEGVSLIGTGGVTFPPGQPPEASIGPLAALSHDDMAAVDQGHATPDEMLAERSASARGPALQAEELIVPLFDLILIEPDEPEYKSKGGILLPDGAKERPMRGKVVAAGPGRRTDMTGVLVPVHVAVGDRVLYPRYTGETVKSGNIDYKMIADKQILAVIRKPGDGD